MAHRVHACLHPRLRGLTPPARHACLHPRLRGLTPPARQAHHAGHDPAGPLDLPLDQAQPPRSAGRAGTLNGSAVGQFGDCLQVGLGSADSELNLLHGLNVRAGPAQTQLQGRRFAGLSAETAAVVQFRHRRTGAADQTGRPEGSKLGRLDAGQAERVQQLSIQSQGAVSQVADPGQQLAARDGEREGPHGRHGLARDQLQKDDQVARDGTLEVESDNGPRGEDSRGANLTPAAQTHAAVVAGLQRWTHTARRPIPGRQTRPVGLGGTQLQVGRQVEGQRRHGAPADPVMEQASQGAGLAMQLPQVGFLELHTPRRTGASRGAGRANLVIPAQMDRTGQPAEVGLDAHAALASLSWNDPLPALAAQTGQGGRPDRALKPQAAGGDARQAQLERAVIAAVRHLHLEMQLDLVQSLARHLDGQPRDWSIIGQGRKRGRGVIELDLTGAGDPLQRNDRRRLVGQRENLEAGVEVGDILDDFPLVSRIEQQSRAICRQGRARQLAQLVEQFGRNQDGGFTLLCRPLGQQVNREGTGCGSGKPSSQGRAISPAPAGQDQQQPGCSPAGVADVIGMGGRVRRQRKGGACLLLRPDKS